MFCMGFTSCFARASLVVLQAFHPLFFEQLVCVSRYAGCAWRKSCFGFGRVLLTQNAASITMMGKELTDSVRHKVKPGGTYRNAQAAARHDRRSMPQTSAAVATVTLLLGSEPMNTFP